ncbi:hypothetical protein [Geopsychrobacter electrodiphilus]|uniref:hypothetical protein n=1 Tax=Geopsychrobacter electrodiphilus TaxID=225196 RepID=UPI000365C448|nr:hypothetical protein [Geopsychrobacter electrodiphilus]
MRQTINAALILIVFGMLTGCGGGGGGSTMPSYTVSTSAGTSGSISPTSATVTANQTTSFTVTPDTGYNIDTVSGCGGSLSGSTYTTGAITADCTVTASFIAAPVAAPVIFTDGQAASVVIGQPDFTSNSIGRTQSLIGGVYGNPDMVNGALYLGDFGNSRVLGFNAIPSSDGANADFVLGAPDFTSVGSLSSAQTVADYNGALYVTVYGDNRIAVYNTVPTAATSAPSAVTPQTPDFYLTANTVGSMSSPESLAVGGGKLVVTDSSNNRVLIWNTIPTSDTAPDLVLGQSDFSGAGINAGGSPSASTLNYPAGAWTDGTRLVVLDEYNNRVLIWNAFPTSNAQPADLVLGQQDFTSVAANQGQVAVPTASTTNDPVDGVTVNGNQLFVTDSGNNRVLIWNSWPTVNGQAADGVLGQTDFVSRAGGTTQAIMNYPTGLHLGGTQLIVGDDANSRYLVFDGHF